MILEAPETSAQGQQEGAAHGLMTLLPLTPLSGEEAPLDPGESGLSQRGSRHVTEARSHIGGLSEGD